MSEDKAQSQSLNVSKITFPKDGGLMVGYREQREVAGDQYVFGNNLESPVPVTANIVEYRDQLRMYLAISNYILGVHIAGKGLNDLTAKEQKELAAVIEKITIKSVTISGMDESRGVKISGTLVAVDGQVVPLQSTFINFEREAFPESRKVEEIVDKLCEAIGTHVQEVATGAQLQLELNGSD